MSTAAGTTASPDVAVLVDVARDLVGVALRSIAPEPVSAAQFRLLLLLHEDGPMPSASAARSLGVAPSSITRVTVRLANAGLLERGSDPSHRGAVSLALTPDGTALVERVLARRYAELEAVLEDLSVQARRDCVAGLDALRAGLPSDRSIGGVW